MSIAVLQNSTRPTLTPAQSRRVSALGGDWKGFASSAVVILGGAAANWLSLKSPQRNEAISAPAPDDDAKRPDLIECVTSGVRRKPAVPESPWVSAMNKPASACIPPLAALDFPKAEEAYVNTWKHDELF